MIQYWFDGPPVEIKVKPHGNSSIGAPFFRTADTAKRRHREIAAANTPRQTIRIATKECGGELEAKGISSLPRNTQQIKNYRRSGHKDSNVLYSVMLQCKLAEGTSDAFVRDVKAAPDPQSVLFFDWQLRDLVRFLTDENKFSIFTTDTTYNLGDFYVTPTTYRHLMLSDITSQKHPVMAGPVLVHQRKNFLSFNYFANTLIGFEKKLIHVQAFGTDGDHALIEAFGHNFPHAKQLRCFIHMKKNIESKLKENGLPSSISQEFISDIFGKNMGGIYEEGLVDATSSVEFDCRLENCRNVWNVREKQYRGSGQRSFYDYFVSHCADVMRDTMLKNVRVAVGLGSPPSIFTTNASESLNAALKKKVNHKESEWPEFNEAMKEYIVGQREEVIRALSGRGQYRFTEEYKHLVVSPQEWVKMTPDQRKSVVKRFDSATVKSPVSCSQYSENCPGESSVSTQQRKMTISVQDSGITMLPFATLDFMWKKAEDYLASSNSVMPAPGKDLKSKMVMSHSSDTPHYVRMLSPGRYVCDKQCLQWSSSQICSHTLVAAEANGDLLQFLQWFNDSCAEPNITQLAKAGLPSGRGRKGGIPKRKRKKVATSVPSVVVPRQATTGTQQHTTQPAQHVYQGGQSSVQESSSQSGQPAQGGRICQPSALQQDRQLSTQGRQTRVHQDGEPTKQTSIHQGEQSTTQRTVHQGGQPSNQSGQTEHAQPSIHLPSSKQPITQGGHPNLQQGKQPGTQQGALPRSQQSQSPLSAGIGLSLQSAAICQSTAVNVLHSSTVANNSQIFNSTSPTSPVLCQQLFQPMPSVEIAPSPTAPNTNPFYIRFIEGNIRMCQGCRSSLRNSSGMIPTPPFDLCSARAERRSFRDASGTLITPRREQPAHYHLNILCIQAAAPEFVPASLLVPADVIPKLKQTHKEYLRLIFGLIL